MSLTDYIITVFCLIDDMLTEMKDDGLTLRSRGPAPKLADSVVLACEIIGEFLGYDTDSGIFHYFRRHHGAFFPKLLKVHRTTFTRQAANLWAVKQRLHQRLLRRIACDPTLWIIDSFPMPVCRLARAYRCRVLAEEATYGYDEMAKQTFYGLRSHLRVVWPGVVVESELAPANVHDLSVAPALTDEAQGVGLADRNYWSPRLFAELAEAGTRLITPKKRGASPHWSRSLTQKRRRIETVIGQFVERFQAKHVWARDRWHLCNRWLRKLCSHTLAVLLCQQQGLPPLQFAKLITD
ncbi:IS982 family transposase [Rhodocaloribacter litoris]|uniref:IS982 family transposase n=1 Tax=Rhodocaloribacter litoris TaxID=2558931 RepID=UPI001E3D55E4|nr:IS982 family transposase [Rhodocaloribacter litoris]QXD15063.1 IS982 family transposase [Rhodocaloribacter litoris]